MCFVFNELKKILDLFLHQKGPGLVPTLIRFIYHLKDIFPLSSSLTSDQPLWFTALVSYIKRATLVNIWEPLCPHQKGRAIFIADH